MQRELFVDVLVHIYIYLPSYNLSSQVYFDLFFLFLTAFLDPAFAGDARIL